MRRQNKLTTRSHQIDHYINWNILSLCNDEFPDTIQLKETIKTDNVFNVTIQ